MTQIQESNNFFGNYIIFITTDITKCSKKMNNCKKIQRYSTETLTRKAKKFKELKYSVEAKHCPLPASKLAQTHKDSHELDA